MQEKVFLHYNTCKAEQWVEKWMFIVVLRLMWQKEMPFSFTGPFGTSYQRKPIRKRFDQVTSNFFFWTLSSVTLWEKKGWRLTFWFMTLTNFDKNCFFFFSITFIVVVNKKPPSRTLCDKGSPMNKTYFSKKIGCNQKKIHTSWNKTFWR